MKKLDFTTVKGFYAGRQMRLEDIWVGMFVWSEGGNWRKGDLRAATHDKLWRRRIKGS